MLYEGFLWVGEPACILQSGLHWLEHRVCLGMVRVCNSAEYHGVYFRNMFQPGKCVPRREYPKQTFMRLLLVSMNRGTVN